MQGYLIIFKAKLFELWQPDWCRGESTNWILFRPEKNFEQTLVTRFKTAARTFPEPSLRYNASLTAILVSSVSANWVLFRPEKNL